MIRCRTHPTVTGNTHRWGSHCAPEMPPDATVTDISEYAAVVGTIVSGILHGARLAMSVHPQRPLDLCPRCGHEAPRRPWWRRMWPR